MHYLEEDCRACFLWLSLTLDIQGMKEKYQSDSSLAQPRTIPRHTSLRGSAGSQGSAGREGFVSVGDREREVEMLTFSSPRLFQRRGGVVGDINVSSFQRLVREGGGRE